MATRRKVCPGFLSPVANSYDTNGTGHCVVCSKIDLQILNHFVV